MLAFFALEAHAERFLERLFDGVEAGEGMVFSPRAGLASIGRKEPSHVLGLDERSPVEHHASEKIREQRVVFGEGCERVAPEVSGCGCQRVGFQDTDGFSRTQSKELELAEIGDEDKSVLAEVAEGLGLAGESVEVVISRLDFCNAALGVLEQIGLGTATLALWLRKESAVGESGSAVAELGGKKDSGLESLAYSIEEAIKGRVKGGFGGC